MTYPTSIIKSYAQLGRTGAQKTYASRLLLLLLSAAHVFATVHVSLRELKLMMPFPLPGAPDTGEREMRSGRWIRAVKEKSHST